MPAIRYLLHLILIVILFSCGSEPEKKPPVEIKKRFQFAPPAPQNGTLKGVIELGGYGFNAFIINIDSAGNWELEDAQYGVSHVYTDGVTESAIRTGLENYKRQMIEYGVEEKYIHFVTSSTASRNRKVQAISKVLRELGFEVNMIEADREAEYVLLATLPKAFREKGFVVDIGTGNTKISWIENDSIKTFETFGSGYFLNGINEKEVSNQVGALMSRLPPEKAKMCFIIGGVPFRLARDIRKDNERYTLLKKPDSYQFPDDKQMSAGLNIYSSISKATQSEHYIFDWESNFSIGYLLEQESQ